MISVLLPVHNGSLFLNETIKSILDQTYTNFELIILDDSSSDNSIKIAEKYNDARIKIVRSNFNSLSRNLNYGLKLSQFNFVARIDQDDTISKDRLSKQLNFLVNNPDFFAVFSWINFIDPNSQKIGCFKPRINLSNQRFRILFENPFVHPSVMFRKNIVEVEYSNQENLVPPEDYELWSRLILENNIKIFTLKEKLTNYRINNPNSMTNSIDNLKANTSRLIQNNLNTYFPNLNSAWVEFISLRLQNQITISKYSILFSFFQILKIYFNLIEYNRFINFRFIFYFLFKIYLPIFVKKLIKN